MTIPTTRASEDITASFEEFFRREFPRVVRSLLITVGELDLARDLAQEAMVRTLLAWDGLESEEHARRFALRVGINLARSRWRSDQHLRGGNEVSVTMTDPDASDRLVLLDALSRLSDRQRASITLVDYLGMDVSEAAEVLGMRPSTVRVHLTRGRRHLASSLRSTFRPEQAER